MFPKDFVTESDIFDRSATSVTASEYPFNNMAAMQMPGAVVILEMNVLDYSMAQIARIVEENNAKIWSSHVTPAADSLKMELTLKINQSDLTFIIRSLTRYGYVIKASFQAQNRNDDLIRNHYDQFMLYLNV